MLLEQEPGADVEVIGREDVGVAGDGRPVGLERERDRPRVGARIAAVGLGVAKISRAFLRANDVVVGPTNRSNASVVEVCTCLAMAAPITTDAGVEARARCVTQLVVEQGQALGHLHQHHVDAVGQRVERAEQRDRVAVEAVLPQVGGHRPMGQERVGQQVRSVAAQRHRHRSRAVVHHDQRCRRGRPARRRAPATWCSRYSSAASHARSRSLRRTGYRANENSPWGTTSRSMRRRTLSALDPTAGFGIARRARHPAGCRQRCPVESRVRRGSRE